MIEIILPKMVQQKRGIIINISSQASERPMPLMTTYAASNYIFDYFQCNDTNFKI
jgi:17beta-estradiol 17-dehydrogenase / very-long-chain 3-oxoacyl-CoA reductase